MPAKKIIRVAKPADQSAPAASTPAGKPAAPAPPRRRAKGGSLAPLFIIFGIIIAVAAGAFVSGQKKAKVDRLVALEVRTLKAQADGRAEEVTDICKRVVALAPQTKGLIEAAKGSVRTVLDKDITRSLRKQSAPAAPAAQTDHSAGSPPGAKPAKAAPAGMQDGILTPEALAAMHARNAQQSEAPAAPASGDKAPPALSMSSHPGLRRKHKNPPIWDAGRAVCTGVESVELHASLATDLIKLTTRELAETHNEFYLEIVQKKLASFEVRKQEAERLLEVATEALKQATAASVTVEELETAHINAEKERVAQAERERKAAESKATEEREVSAVATVKASMTTLAKEYRYEDALAEGERVLASITTPKALKTGNLIVDQFKELAQMKGYMIQQLNKAPLRWGWRQDKPTRDIIGADRDILKTLGKDVPWAKVSPPQFEAILKTYFADERTAPSLKVKYGPGVALYYMLQGNTEEAKHAANQVIRSRDSERERVERLVPILVP